MSAPDEEIRRKERELEIIGEAARNVSGPFKQAHTEKPWQPRYGDISHLRTFKGKMEHVKT